MLSTELGTMLCALFERGTEFEREMMPGGCGGTRALLPGYGAVLALSDAPVDHFLWR
jgi:hypothetical protein